LKFFEQPRKHFDYSKEWKGKKKNYVISINYCANGSNYAGQYYFFVEKKDIDFRFNSLWNNMKYSTYDECAIVAEKYLEDNILSKQ